MSQQSHSDRKIKLNILNEPQKAKIKLLEVERARLMFHSVELNKFDDAVYWIELGVLQFKKRHILRPQLSEEMENVAYEHIQERWQSYPKPITPGLIIVMAKTCLQKYATKDKSFFSNAYPERELNGFVIPDKLRWQQKYHDPDTKLDIAKVRTFLSHEGRLILDLKLIDCTNEEIMYWFRALEYKDTKHLFYSELEIIAAHFRRMGYGNCEMAKMLNF